MFTFMCLEGCHKPRDKNREGQQPTQGGDMSVALTDSASYKLLADDLDKFQPGRTKTGILEEVEWRGELYMAAEYKGEVVSAIIYELLSDGPNDRGGIWVWATFVDDKFLKFVKPPPSVPGDSEVVGHSKNGTPITRPKPLNAGDTRFLIRGRGSEGVSVQDLKRELKSLTARPQQVDQGLTAAYLLLRTTGAVPGPDAPASQKDYQRNAALRDQFNALRLNVGMSQSAVEGALKAKPLESGKVEAGLYSIYGSNESFNMMPWLHFSNILVIFRHGKAIVICNVPAGPDWRRELAERTADLPAHPSGPSKLN